MTTEKLLSFHDEINGIVKATQKEIMKIGEEFDLGTVEGTLQGLAKYRCLQTKAYEQIAKLVVDLSGSE